MRMRPLKARRGVMNPAFRRRGMYILPNAFTTAALFFGFWAIVMAMNKEFVRAAEYIFVAMVLDSLDGRVARATNTQSEFGAQYDSLSDMVSFGVAPALVIYEWSLHGFAQWGAMAAFFYCAMAALRLARFNTNIEVVDKRFFQGLPSPAAAAIVAGFVWVMSDNRVAAGAADNHLWVDWIGLLLTVYAGGSMFVTVPFYSGKDMNRNRPIPVGIGVTFTLVFVLILLTVSANPPGVLFAVALTYGLSGYAMWLWKRRHRPAESKRQQDLF